jgi:hypothetical protein
MVLDDRIKEVVSVEVGKKLLVNQVIQLLKTEAV